jgi:RNA polymerase sigma factor (sigma-70 family)
MPSDIHSNNSALVEETESTLIARCLANDRLSQHELYKLYARKMMAVCIRYSKSREDAEDTLSEGFARVFEKLHTYKGAGSFEGWIRRIMVNIAIEKFRKKQVQFTELKEELAGNPELAEESNLQVDAKQLLALVQQLPPAYQMVFNLYVFEGLKHREIASELRISEGTSKSNLSHARTWLRKGIEKLSGSPIPQSHE